MGSVKDVIGFGSFGVWYGKVKIAFFLRTKEKQKETF